MASSFFPLLCSGEQFYRWLCSISEQLCKDLKQMLKQTTNNICFKSALTDEANHPTPNIRRNVDDGLNAVYFPIMLCDQKGEDNSTLTEPQKPIKYETESDLELLLNRWIPSGCCQQHLEKLLIHSEVSAEDILTFARFRFPAVRFHNFFSIEKKLSF